MFFLIFRKPKKLLTVTPVIPTTAGVRSSASPSLPTPPPLASLLVADVHTERLCPLMVKLAEQIQTRNLLYRLALTLGILLVRISAAFQKLGSVMETMIVWIILTKLKIVPRQPAQRMNSIVHQLLGKII